MVFSRFPSILPVVVTMALSVLPLPTHGFECKFLELIPVECQVENGEYLAAKDCIGSECPSDFEGLMPWISDFLKESQNFAKDCMDVNEFMKGMIGTCGSCSTELVELVDCVATFEANMNEGTKGEIQTFINILEQNGIEMSESDEILQFINDDDGSCHQHRTSNRWGLGFRLFDGFL